MARTQHRLPAARLQGEHTVAALQTEPTVLRPGKPGPRASTGSIWLSIWRRRRPTARYAASALADPAAIPPAAVRGPDLAEPAADHRSLFGTAGPLDCRPLTTDELNGLAGTARIEAEYDGADLLSFFTAAGMHVVTAAKQARVLRPHGHLLRSGTSLLPDEPSICATSG